MTLFNASERSEKYVPRLSSNTGPPATQIGRFARSAGDFAPADRAHQKPLAVVEGHRSEEQAERLFAPELPRQPARHDVDVRGWWRAR